ncbi:lysylphosphatidylglycerol synthase transmembrane domain-containing protein [Pirellulaceae bacterium SH501]
MTPNPPLSSDPKPAPVDPKPAPNKSAPPVWRKRLLQLAIVAVVAAFLYWTVQKAVMEIRSQEGKISWSDFDWRLLAISIPVYCLGLFPGAIAWMQTLRTFGQDLPRIATLNAYFLGHLGKYVPGKAMVLILRVGKLQPLGLAIRAGVVSVFVETLTGVATASVLGAILLLPLDVPLWLKIAAACGLPFAAVALTPHFFKMGIGIVAKSKIGKMPKSIPSAFTVRFMIRNSFWMALGWLIQGTAGWLILLAMSQQPELQSWMGWSAVVSAVCLGAVAGFASMLPGGAVVREVVITWLLAPLVGQPIALLAAVVIRLANLAGECLIISAVMAIPAKPVPQKESKRD